MILGIILLIFGLLIVSAGAYGWYYYIPSLFGYRFKRYLLLFMILGGCLVIGGIVRMVVN